jgi:hypothetical protein
MNQRETKLINTRLAKLSKEKGLELQKPKAERTRLSNIHKRISKLKTWLNGRPN